MKRMRWVWVRYVQRDTSTCKHLLHLPFLQTIQTIAFIAYLRVRVEAPFLIVCPLSVLHNWIDGFKRFALKVSIFALQCVLMS